MDKMGHLYTSYQIARHTAALYKMTGISKRQMLVYGAISGVIFSNTDRDPGRLSPDYGFSPGDMVANTMGSALLPGANRVMGRSKDTTEIFISLYVTFRGKTRAAREQPPL